MMMQVPSGGAGGAGAVNSGFVRLFLRDPSERDRSQHEIAASLRGLARELTAARVNVTQEASMGERRSTSSDVEFVLQAPTLELLRDRCGRCSGASGSARARGPAADSRSLAT